MAESRLQVVGEEPDNLFPTAPPPRGTKIATDLITLAISTLSQRTVIALSNLFTLGTVGSAFVLFYVTPDPTPYQLIKLAMYGVFVLGANWIVRRR